MSLKKYILLYRRMEELIEKESTGTPEQLAYKLGISQRQLFNYLNDLRDLGMAIEYCHQRQSYCFHHNLEYV